MLEDVLTGAVTNGVNLSTFIVLNALLLVAVLSLASLLVLSLSGAPAAAPHCGALLLLALGLWASIDWYVICVIGFADPEQQRRQLEAGGASGGEGGGADAQQPPGGQQQQQQQHVAAAAAGGKKQR